MPRTRALLDEAAEHVEADPPEPQPPGYRLTKLLEIPILLLMAIAPPPRLSAMIVRR
jgi:hypothetical protein